MKTFLYLSVILLYFQFLSAKCDCPKLDKNNKEWFDLDPFGCFHLGTYDTQRDTATQYCKDLTTGYEISDLAEIRSQEVQFMLTGIFIERNLTKESWWIGASKVIIPITNFFTFGNSDKEYKLPNHLGKWKILLG